MYCCPQTVRWYYQLPGVVLLKPSTPLPQSYLCDVLAHTAVTVLEAQGDGEVNLLAWREEEHFDMFMCTQLCSNICTCNCTIMCGVHIHVHIRSFTNTLIAS